MREAGRLPRPDAARRVALIISGHLGIDPVVIAPEASLVDDLGANSLDSMEPIIAFEEAFNIEIPEADVERIGTVKALALFFDHH